MFETSSIRRGQVEDHESGYGQRSGDRCLAGHTTAMARGQGQMHSSRPTLSTVGCPVYREQSLMAML